MEFLFQLLSGGTQHGGHSPSGLERPTCLVHPCCRGLLKIEKIPTASEMQEKSPGCHCVCPLPSPCSFYLAVYSTIVSHHVKSLLCFVKRTAYLLRVCVLFATISPRGSDKTGFSVSFLVLSYRNAENFILQLSITNTRRNYHERRRNPNLGNPSQNFYRSSPYGLSYRMACKGTYGRTSI